MRYCERCGKQLKEDSNYCSYCGASTSGEDCRGYRTYEYRGPEPASELAYTGVLAEVFEFTDMDYYAGMKVFDKTLETLGVKMSQNKRYELYDKIYDESIKERKQTYAKSRNSP